MSSHIHLHQYVVYTYTYTVKQAHPQLPALHLQPHLHDIDNHLRVFLTQCHVPSSKLDF